MTERALDERNVFAYGRAMKEQRRTKLLGALTGGGENDVVDDDDAALERLADKLADRLVAKLAAP